MLNMIYQERLSDSPHIELVMHGITQTDESVIRPATPHWHMVFTRYEGRVMPIVVGPWTSSGVASVKQDAEILWIRFKLGSFMPYLPTKKLLNSEIMLPEAAGKSFWLKGAAWQFPNFDNTDTFVDKLVRDGLIISDQVVNAALEDQPPDISLRTIRHRFLQATGLSHTRIRQFERANQAMNLLQQGVSILDVVSLAGYADQPHLTRSLKQYVGYTPAQVLNLAT